jgi:hypothetical protein
MKNLLYILVLSTLINATEQNSKQLNALEMFLFKIGYTALINDFDNEKNNTKLNTIDIMKLKKDIKYILENMDKDGPIKKSNLLVIKNDENKSDKLQKEINNLKNEIKSLKIYIDTKINSNIKKKVILKQTTTYGDNSSKEMNINGSNVNVRDMPFLYGKVVGVLQYNDKVSIELCNKYGWCKIKGKNHYIAKYLLY